MKTRYIYLIFFLIFLALAAVFTFFREPIGAMVNATLIGIGEGRSIRVDNTDMIKRKTSKQVVKVQGAAKIARAAQAKLFPGKLDTPPVTKLIAGKAGSRRTRAAFIREWAVLGTFELKIVPQKSNRKIILEQECMSADPGPISFQQVPKGYEWNRLLNLSNDGRINLTEAFRKNTKPAAAWLAADLELDRDYDAVMLLGIQQAGRVFLNGKEVFVSKAKSPTRADGVRVKVQLIKGRNRLLVKTASANPRSWFVFLRFMTGKQPLMPPSAKPAASPAPTQNTPPAKPAGTSEKASPSATGK